MSKPYKIETAGEHDAAVVCSCIMMVKGNAIMVHSGVITDYEMDTTQRLAISRFVTNFKKIPSNNELAEWEAAQ